MQQNIEFERCIDFCVLFQDRDDRSCGKVHRAASDFGITFDELAFHAKSSFKQQS